MKKFTISFLAACLISASAVAQLTIIGTVLDQSDNKPLAGAVITTEQSNRLAVSSEDGTFRLPVQKGGTLIITTNLLGYKPQTDTIDMQQDSTIVILLTRSAYLQSEVIISSTRADDRSGVAYSTLTKSDIEKENNGRDIPYMLQSTPSLVATSDAGTGVGYTGVRIRGSDATRINVTLNGIPLNDAESQQLYWVDLPDLASSTDNIQIQRGVGTSTNGAGAFGGSINILSSKPSEKAYATSTNSFGSFNTIRNNISLGTGMIDGKWNMEGRLSRISSDGYIDRATSDLKSAYFSGGYYGKKDLFKVNILYGKEITYQSWLGVPEYILDTNRTYNSYTYKNQVDDYRQDHYQFFWAHDAGKGWTINTALHYTKGKGYYEEYKEDQPLSAYGLPDVILSSDTITETDLVRRKWLDNDFYGATWSVQYEPESKTTVTIGGAVNRYDGDHFGKVIWATFASSGGPDHEYYRNTGVKTDGNIYLKAGHDLTSKLSGYIDLQARTTGYDFTGIDDAGAPLPQSDRLAFFNPKAGLLYRFNDASQAYLSFGIANKEPSRNDYVDNPESKRPGAETLRDVEAGVRHASEKLKAGINLYYMDYKNQLAVTGRLNDVGDPVRVNIPESSRAGVEIEFKFNPSQKLELKGNFTYSSNKIKEYGETIYNYDDGSVTEQIYKNTDLAYSPDITAGATVSWNITRAVSASAISRYVGRQFLDNTSTAERSLEPYAVTDLRLDYRINPRFMKEVVLSFWANNIFNELYESNGYTFSYIYNSSLVTENFYYPQAGTNFILQATLKF